MLDSGQAYGTSSTNPQMRNNKESLLYGDSQTDDEELMREMLNNFSEQWHSEDENLGDEEMLLKEMLPKLDEDGNINEEGNFGTDWMKAIWTTSDTYDKNDV